jgi:hypothetical protein
MIYQANGIYSHREGGRAMEDERERRADGSAKEVESMSPLSSPDKKTRNRRKIDFSDGDIEKIHEYFTQIPEAPEKIRKITTKKELLTGLRKTIALLCQKNYSAAEISKMLTEKCGVQIYTKDITPIIKELERSANAARPVKKTRRRKNGDGLAAENGAEMKQPEPRLAADPRFQGQETAQNHDGDYSPVNEARGLNSEAIPNGIPDAAIQAAHDSQENDSPAEKRPGSFTIEPDIEI